MGNGTNYNDLYKEAVLEAAGDIPVVFLELPQEKSMSEYREYVDQTLAPYSLSPEDIEGITDDIFLKHDQSPSAGPTPTQDGNIVGIVTTLPEGDSYKNLYSQNNLIIQSLSGSEEIWATFIGAHEGQHIHNRQSSSYTLQTEDNSDEYAIHEAQKRHGLTDQETAELKEEINRVRAVNSLNQPDHNTHLTESDQAGLNHVNASHKFTELIGSNIREHVHANPSLQEKINELYNSGNLLEIDKLKTDIAAKLLKEGALDGETNPLVQTLKNDFLEAYEYFNTPKLETLDGKPVLDSNGNAIQIGSDASNDPSASIDPNLFKSPASSPAHINTAANNMEPNSVKSLSGEFLAKGAANEDGAPSVQVIPKSEQDAVLAENSPSPALTPAA